MSQETHQQSINGKEPLMYVSGVLIIFNSILTVFSVLFLLSAFAQASKTPEGTGMIAAFVFAPSFTLLLPLLVVLFLIASLFKNPKQYIQTKFVDVMFVVPVIVTILFLSFIFSSDTSPSISSFIVSDGYLLIPMFIGVGVAIFLNHKFQKPGTELVVIK